MCTHMPTHTCARVRADTPGDTHTRARTHTHTQCRALYFSLSLHCLCRCLYRPASQSLRESNGAAVSSPAQLPVHRLHRGDPSSSSSRRWRCQRQQARLRPGPWRVHDGQWRARTLTILLGARGVACCKYLGAAEADGPARARSARRPRAHAVEQLYSRTQLLHVPAEGSDRAGGRAEGPALAYVAAARQLVLAREFLPAAAQYKYYVAVPALRSHRQQSTAL